MRAEQHKRAALGRAGEAHAADFYRDRGAEIIGENVSYPVGEIDLIAREPDDTHVFIEVKTRSTLDFGGAESVTPAKRRRVRAAAVRWLEERRVQGKARVPIRFDVLLLVPRSDGTFDVEYFEGI